MQYYRVKDYRDREGQNVQLEVNIILFSGICLSVYTYRGMSGAMVHAAPSSSNSWLSKILGEIDSFWKRSIRDVKISKNWHRIQTPVSILSWLDHRSLFSEARLE